VDFFFSEISISEEVNMLSVFFGADITGGSELTAAPVGVTGSCITIGSGTGITGSCSITFGFSGMIVFAAFLQKPA